ncbi:antitoxin Xre/MbcA/ParS toxin-binding domain-containing protein [Luteibacter sp. NPDC031894]|uniref:antitoxin Xre/MbcA/ParS toxin-binding domain-containing protein n=1 Tax=Luteibacter sp. NPDC031894 TaxID=3390572 RepID=UPI003D07655C
MKVGEHADGSKQPTNKLVDGASSITCATHEGGAEADAIYREPIGDLAVIIGRALPGPYSLPYIRISQQSLHEISTLAKTRISFHFVALLAKDLNVERDALARYLDICPRAAQRHNGHPTKLSVGESERAIGCAVVIGQVMKMVGVDKSPMSPDILRWLGGWLTSPLPALGSRKPISFFDTMAGQSLVTGLLACIESGSFA